MVDLEFNCPENIHAMPVDRNGFFCGSCEKTIIDYSGKSNEEIAALLKKQSGKNCGVFKSTQVKNVERSRFNALFRLAFSAVFFLGLNAGNLFGQDTLNFNNYSDTTVATPIPVNNNTITVKGQIRDIETGEEIVFAKVWVEVGGQQFFAISDFEGNYQIIIPQEVVLGVPFELHTRIVGYEEHVITEILVRFDQETVSINVELVQPPYLIAGIIIKEINSQEIDRNPYDFGKTVIKGDDLRRMP